jgi:hypothetical protein
MEQKKENCFRKRYFFLVAGSIILVALFLYGQVLEFAYVWDDLLILRKIPPVLKGEVSLADFLGRPFLRNVPYFRPLVILSFYFDASITGHPGFSHAVSLAVFVLNALLVFVIGKRIAEKTGRTPSVYLAGFAALLYVVHPVMIESAAWISGRFDALVSFFVLSATWVYLGTGFRRLRIVLVSVLVFLSLLCKEIGAISPVAMLCLWGAIHFPSLKNETWAKISLRALRENQGFLAGFALVFTMYLFVLWQSGASERYIATFLDKLQESGRGGGITLFWVLESLKFYLAQSFSPFYEPSPVHPIDSIVSPWSASDILGNAATLVFAGGVCFFAARKRAAAAWIFLAGLLYLSPVLNVAAMKIGVSLGHARFLTLPLAFWVIAVTLVAHDLIQVSWRFDKFLPTMHVLSAKRILGGLAGVWVLFMAATTYFTIPLWKNDLVLWSWAHRVYPDNDFLQNQYMASALMAERPDLVEKEISAVLEKPDNPGLRIKMQLFYGAALLSQKKPLAKDYLQGLIDSVEEFHIHELPKLEAREKLEQMWRQDGETSRPVDIVTAAYFYYAQTILYFENNPRKALEMNTICQWYMDESSYLKSWSNVWQIVYLYAMGEFEQGDSLLMTIKSPEEQAHTKIRINNTLVYYCHKFPSEHCKTMAEKGVVAVAPQVLQGQGKNDAIMQKPVRPGILNP